MLQIHGEVQQDGFNVSNDRDPTRQHFGTVFPYAERCSVLFHFQNWMLCVSVNSKYEDRELEYEGSTWLG